eukprot:CAMPEP_0184493802 /NCGR_PEP_ID=MMETSP0113_2-20130426/27000_1 /TAXON_ID=91329 /ORGANISM="Norrisiella sphaerica, Strain BC52" /LENGTH=326 /DNA_ID=CAMNT_0026879237 /DNA_START=12 /DNA_END=992 /DNA_ORIENTATION=+
MSVDDICAMIAMRGPQGLISKKKKKRKERDRSLKNPILVRNVNPNVKDDMVEETFSTCGNIKSMVRYKEEGANMMHKFVIHFEKQTGQMAAIALMKKGMLMAGCPLDVIVPTPEQLENTRNAHKKFKKQEKALRIKASKEQEEKMKKEVKPEDVVYVEGQLVTVEGLAKLPKFNGMIGTICGEKLPDGRWPVLLSVRPGKPFNLKPQNIKASWADREKEKKKQEYQMKKKKEALPNWVCRVCKNENFGWRKKCNKCRKPKEDPNRQKEAVAPPEDRDDYNTGGHAPGCGCSKCKPFAGVSATINKGYLAKAMAAAKKIGSRLNKFE